MGEVFEAFDREHHARVALKVLTRLTPETLLRFKNEIRALHDLEHPNVVSFGELLEEDGRWFFTMELIEGPDFLAYVRPGNWQEPPTTAVAVIGAGAGEPPTPTRPKERRDHRGRFDEARLRDALGQLGRGVAALHAAGKVHRDIKPSNVRVTSDGRVVLLDFGLVTDIEDPVHITCGELVVGTPAFMAPEQAARSQVGPAADWYSVGVMLYLTLTGQLPFTGAPLEMLRNKQILQPTPPSRLDRQLPPDLDALCVDLLATDPSARPSDDEMLRRLEAMAPLGQPNARAGPAPTHAPPFIGRVGELADLDRLFELTRQGRTLTVYVEGESGVGKTALVRRFTERLVKSRGAVVLAGRCYESESVPFKAVDGLIDALSRYLMVLPMSEAVVLLPSKAALLMQVFPVLRSVRAIAEAPPPLEEIRDPQELRSRVFAAVRELLVRLAERRPVILVIDDMQWSDADSLALLREILRPPDAPPLMLLLTARGQAEGGGPEGLALPGEVQRLPLARLTPTESRALAARLLEDFAGEHRPDRSLADVIAEEAGGHPLFVDELARRARAGEQATRLRLEEALWERIAEIDPKGRDILRLLAVAGAPLDKETVARALGMGFNELHKCVSLLRVSHLVRGSDGGRADCVEPYHDRVRAAVIEQLDAGERADCHRRVALALEAARDFDYEALATHWQGAGEAATAATYALLAASEAARALAFVRAAELYRNALELGVEDAAKAQQARIGRADALKNAGRGPEAAVAYLDAAAAAPSSAARLELQRRAAEQLLLSGHLDHGLSTMKTVVDAAGLRMPATPRRALLSLMVNRARLRLRGLGFVERDASQISAEQLTRIDVSWSTSAGLSVIDNFRGADFQCRNLLQALDAGEPHRIARALAMEAGYSATGGLRTERRTRRLLDACLELATRLRDPYAIGLQKLVAGLAAVLSARWSQALELCDQAETLLRSRCIGVAWEVDSAQMFGMYALWHLGRTGELQRRVPLRLAEAQERGDLYAVANCRSGAANVIWLTADAPDEARREVAEAMVRWSRSGVHVQHYFEALALTQIDLYADDGEAAYARLIERWPAFRRALLLQIELVRLTLLDLRARSALAAARGSHAAARLRAVESDARRLEHGGMSFCRPAAHLLRAGVAQLRGQRERAVAALQEAARGFSEAEMLLHACAARRQLGRLIDGDEGRTLAADADAWLAHEGVRNPERLVAMLAPGFRF
jgi:hypothetical protein